MKVIKYKTTRALVAFVFVIVFFYFLCKWLSSLFDGKSSSYNNKCNLKHAQYIIEEMCDVYKYKRLAIGSMCASLCNPRNKFKSFGTYKLVGCYNQNENRELNADAYEFKTVLVYQITHPKYVSYETPANLVLKTSHRSFYDFDSRIDSDFSKKQINDQLKFLVTLIRSTLSSNYGIQVDNELIMWLQRYLRGKKEDVIGPDKKLLTNKKDLFYYVNLLSTNNYEYFEEALRRQDRASMAKFIDNFAILLSQEEYVFSKYFSSKNHTLKLYGTCGHFYAIEHAESLGFQVQKMSTDDRKKLGLKFLELVENFESNYLNNLIKVESQYSAEKIKVIEFMEAAPGAITDPSQSLTSLPLQICDVKLENFGLTFSGDLKIIDTDMVHPDSYLFVPRFCSKHDDCHFFDCKSFCDLGKQQCGMTRINNNLQSICEKIFDNFYMPDDALLKNVLKDSIEEKALLQQCSMPAVFNNTDLFTKTDNSVLTKLRKVLS